jgi:hypothetical protein
VHCIFQDPEKAYCKTLESDNQIIIKKRLKNISPLKEKVLYLNYFFTPNVKNLVDFKFSEFCTNKDY